MRCKFEGQIFGGVKAPAFIRREGFARARNRGQADRSLIFHVSILFSGRGRVDESFRDPSEARKDCPSPAAASDRPGKPGRPSSKEPVSHCRYW
jgi:hypothetical protein